MHDDRIFFVFWFSWCVFIFWNYFVKCLTLDTLETPKQPPIVAFNRVPELKDFAPHVPRQQLIRWQQQRCLRQQGREKRWQQIVPRQQLIRWQQQRCLRQQGREKMAADNPRAATFKYYQVTTLWSYNWPFNTVDWLGMLKEHWSIGRQIYWSADRQDKPLRISIGQNSLELDLWGFGDKRLLRKSQGLRISGLFVHEHVTQQQHVQEWGLINCDSLSSVTHWGDTEGGSEHSLP